MSTFVPLGFGWQPDLPDGRDRTFRDGEIADVLRCLPDPSGAALPGEVDLRRDCGGDYFTDVDDQGPLNASSAFAVLALVEYFERRIHARTFDGSKLFLYQATRHRLSATQQPHADSGADIRGTLKTLLQIGVPAETSWPYQTERFGTDPSPFVFAGAKRIANLWYFRLNEPNHTGDQTWAVVKSFLAAGFPVVFGFSVPSSLTLDANIPCRPERDATRGGQTVVAIGYHANRYGPDQDALLIRSSWGRRWGDNGNGWLPVAFIRQQLARDFWTVMSADWLGSGELSRPAIYQ